MRPLLLSRNGLVAKTASVFFISKETVVCGWVQLLTTYTCFSSSTTPLLRDSGPIISRSAAKGSCSHRKIFGIFGFSSSYMTQLSQFLCSIYSALFVNAFLMCFRYWYITPGSTLPVAADLCNTLDITSSFSRTDPRAFLKVPASTFGANPFSLL